ncbi:glycosyltransferase [Patescibacteria group bacterium]|nr:glycosyltransferase [Patescibacteria group bacterium]MBU0846453.1 glycosyltransferase [Patescibacteria group bacterium]
MELSILITAHNRLGTLEQCIASINQNSKYKHEIIVCGDRISKLLVDTNYLPQCYYLPKDYVGPLEKREKDLKNLEKTIVENQYTIWKHFTIYKPSGNVRIIDHAKDVPTHIQTKEWNVLGNYDAPQVPVHERVVTPIPRRRMKWLDRELREQEAES